jgi:CUG-BP- and ETR3-like factor
MCKMNHISVTGMNVNAGNPALASLGMTNMAGLGGVNSLGGNVSSVDALSQAYSGIQQYSGKYYIINVLSCDCSSLKVCLLYL